MQLKISLKRSLPIVIIAGITFFLIIVLFLSFALPGHVYNYYYTKSGSNTSGIPVRLIISNINVEAVINPVGITPQGEMGAPQGPADVAWFSLGPRPGDIGSAVIAGHFGTWKNGRGSVFDDLNKLRKNDKIYIKDENGVITAFIVRGIRIYDPNADASEVFNLSDGMSHLNLITCEGVWDNISKIYSERLVVFTDKEIK